MLLTSKQNARDFSNIISGITGRASAQKPAEARQLCLTCRGTDRRSVTISVCSVLTRYLLRTLKSRQMRRHSNLCVKRHKYTNIRRTQSTQGRYIRVIHCSISPITLPTASSNSPRQGLITRLQLEVLSRDQRKQETQSTNQIKPNSVAPVSINPSSVSLLACLRDSRQRELWNATNQQANSNSGQPTSKPQLKCHTCTRLCLKVTL